MTKKPQTVNCEPVTLHKPTGQSQQAALVQAIADLINKQIQDHGEIQRGNKQIWSVLHKMDNSIWQAYLAGCSEILRKVNTAQSCTAQELVDELEAVIQKHQHQYSNTLTPYPQESARELRPRTHLYQKPVWKLIMIMREILAEETER